MPGVEVLPNEELRAIHAIQHLIYWPQSEDQISINIAVGPKCPVRCEGCYNFFAKTEKLGGLVTAYQVVNFAASAQEVGTTQVTLFGGDPLSHPEIVTIIRDLKSLGLRIKLDTVGTALLGPAQALYQGRGMVPAVSIDDIGPHLDSVSIPLDGTNQEMLGHFRKGRTELFEEMHKIGRLLFESLVHFGVNTVANPYNFDHLEQIQTMVGEMGASEWQVFEFDRDGPNPSSHRKDLMLPSGAFSAKAEELTTIDLIRMIDAVRDNDMSYRPPVWTECKPYDGRHHNYIFVDDAGMAYQRIADKGRRLIGHIEHDRERVIAEVKHFNAIKKQEQVSKKLAHALVPREATISPLDVMLHHQPIRANTKGSTISLSRQRAYTHYGVEATLTSDV